MPHFEIIICLNLAFGDLWGHLWVWDGEGSSAVLSEDDGDAGI